MNFTKMTKEESDKISKIIVDYDGNYVNSESYNTWFIGKYGGGYYAQRQTWFHPEYLKTFEELVKFFEDYYK
jgi:hypothetical protein